MKKGDFNELSNLSMMEIFQVEAEAQAGIITDGLLELERNPAGAQQLEALMRAAHSLKGAARIVNQDAAVSVAHAIEDCFVAAQQGKIRLGQHEVDVLFQSVDLLLDISKAPVEEPGKIEAGLAARVRKYLAALGEVTTGTPSQASTEETGGAARASSSGEATSKTKISRWRYEKRNVRPRAAFDGAKSEPAFGTRGRVVD